MGTAASAQNAEAISGASQEDLVSVLAGMDEDARKKVTDALGGANKGGTAAEGIEINRGVENITYCTDVEGHWPYFCSWVELSEGLSFAEPGDHSQDREVPELVLKDGWHFVFGGDAGDKGPGTLRFLTAMVNLKRAYPERVHLIMGNRDCNKMRWTSELDQAFIDTLSPETPPAHWVKGNLAKSPWDYIKEQAALKESIAKEDVTEELVRKYNTQAMRVHYHLKHDLGSDGDFEYRRQELAHMQSREVCDMTDEEVAQSYVDSVAEGGVLRAYMQLGVLALLLGDTLFVHGQIIGDSFWHCPEGTWCVKAVPDGSNNGMGWRTVENLHDWITGLNAWARDQVADWERQPTWSTAPKVPEVQDWRGRGGADLIIYVTPDTPAPSVVYVRWLEKDNMPKKYPEELVAYLRGHGVSRVIVGHTPHGNCPTIIPHSGGLTLVMADTSFSTFQSNAAYKGDNRGSTVCDVSLCGKNCVVSGRQQATPTQAVKYNSPPVGENNDPHVGLVQTAEEADNDKRFFVKAKVQDSDVAKYLLCNIQGFRVSYREVEEAWVQENFAHPEQPNVLDFSAASQESKVVVLTSHGEDFGHGMGGSDGHLVKHFLESLGFTEETLAKDPSQSVEISTILARCDETTARQALTWSKPGMTLEQALAAIDINKDGSISVDELRRVVHHGPHAAS